MDDVLLSGDIMITAMFLWVSVGILSLFHMGKYSNSLFAYVAIGAFFGAVMAYLNLSFMFQLATVINMALFLIIVTETGFKNIIWMIFALSEIVFFAVYAL